MSMFGQSPGRQRARPRALTRCVPPLAGGLLLAACNVDPENGRSLGADLGTFSVEASEAANDCGPGALGSTPRLSFDVELARADTELFWDGKVGGNVRADLSFDVAARARFELRAAAGSDLGCAIVRDDSISGELLADDGGTVTAFSADMRFAFAAEPNATCTPRELAEADLSSLPCSMLYALDGRRTRAPEP